MISNKTQETGALDINWLQFFFAFGYSKNKEAILQENNCQIYNQKKKHYCEQILKYEKWKKPICQTNLEKKYANLCRRMQDYKKKMPIYEKKQDKFIKKIYK